PCQDRIRLTILKDKQDKEAKKQDIGPDMVTDPEQIDKRVKTASPEPSISQLNIETQINIDKNSVSGKSSKIPTFLNNMTSPTEHNATEQQQYTIHLTSSPEIEIQHEIHNEEPITTSPTKNRKNGMRATLNDMFFDTPGAPILNLKGRYIIKKIETESYAIIKDNTPEKRNQRSYSKAVTERQKRDRKMSKMKALEVKEEFDEIKWDYDKIIEAF
ncbi:19517_t:CDS:2, partial [Gigaspora margarita]